MEIERMSDSSKDITTLSAPSILIAGGYGLVGGTIARHIRKIYKDVALILAGRNPEKGTSLANELGNAKSVYLDIHQDPDWKSIGEVDLIIAALQDHRDSLIHYAMSHDISHIGITKLADEITPVTFQALKKPPKRPIVLLGHWQAGVLMAVALKVTGDFSQISTVEAAGFYDPRDPIGPMVEQELEDFIGQALVREAGKWKWVVAPQHGRQVRIGDDREIKGYPIGTLDVPSLAAITHAANVRFDLVQGDSLGTLAGNKASHDLYIDVEGELRSGKTVKRRVIISDPNGQAHLTALGVLVAAERILNLDGQTAAKGGLHLPETLIQPDLAIERFKQFGVTITHIDL